MTQHSDDSIMPGARVETYKTTGQIELKLWIFTPEDHDPGDQRPAIVCFHGGGWRKGHPNQFHKHCEYLAARGMVAITVQYRVYTAHQATVDLCVADAKSAMRWTRRHAKRLGIDPDRIVAGGSSAGGLLAAATASLDLYDDPMDDLSVDVQPNAMILLNPVLVLSSVPGKFEFADFAFNLKDAIEMDLEVLLGVAPESLCPYHHMPAEVGPTIIFHGMADDIVPYHTAELFQKKMIAQGNRCELLGYEDAGHGYFNYSRHQNAPYIHSVYQMDRFLVSLGYLNDVPKYVHYT